MYDVYDTFNEMDYRLVKFDGIQTLFRCLMVEYGNGDTRKSEDSFSEFLDALNAIRDSFENQIKEFKDFNKAEFEKYVASKKAIERKEGQAS
jgi:hypothetical protein